MGLVAWTREVQWNYQIGLEAGLIIKGKLSKKSPLLGKLQVNGPTMARKLLGTKDGVICEANDGVNCNLSWNVFLGCCLPGAEI